MTQIAALQWEEIPIATKNHHGDDNDVTNNDSGSLQHGNRNGNVSAPDASKLVLNMKNHAAVHHGDKIYILGGNYRERMDVIIYHIPTQKWSRVLYADEQDSRTHRNPNVANNGGTRRFRFLNAVSHRRIRGGSDGTRAAMRLVGGNNDMRALSLIQQQQIQRAPDQDERVTMTGPKPHFRNGHTATLVQKYDGNEEKHYIFVIGGWLGDRTADQVLILDITNPRVLEWTSFPECGVSPGPCNMHSAEYIPDKRQIYVFRGGDGSEYLNDLHALDVDTMTWQKVETVGIPPEPRADHASAYMHSTKEFFVFGGWNGSNRLNDFYILDTVTLSWRRPVFHGTVPQARAGMTLSAVKDRLYLFGGNGSESATSNDLHIFDRSSMEWLESDSTNLLGTSQHSHVSLLPSEQSHNANGSVTNICHNPNSIETVSKVSIHGRQPPRRAGHSATAVGRFIYIVGGSSGSEYRNDCHVLDTDNLHLPPETETQISQMMQSRLRDHFNTEDLADVVFLVQGRRIYAHKIVLCLSSQVYRAMFLNDFKEKNATRPEIQVPNCPYETFLSVLEYMYTGDIDLSLEASAYGAGESVERILSILEMADHLLLDHLKARCERALLHAVNATSIEFLMQFAQQSNARRLEAMCMHFVRNNCLDHHPMMQV